MVNSHCIRVTFFALAMLVGVATAPCSETHRVIGDGVHDDTAGLQALLDSGRSEVHFPCRRSAC